MRIEVYAVAWNEERRLPRFLKHYGHFAHKIQIWDNHSTDRTAELVREARGEVCRWSSGEQYAEHERQKIRNNCWCGSLADWVIVCDVDEILWHPNLVEYLYECQRAGITIPRTDGYHMVSETHGAKDTAFDASNFDKCVIFDPCAIKAMNFSPGSHSCQPVGRVAYSPTADLKLLHYSGFDEPEWLWLRYQAADARRQEADRAAGKGFHYGWTRGQFDARLAMLREHARPVI